MTGPAASTDAPPALRELAERAHSLEGPLVTDAGFGIGVVGPQALAGACARGIVLQLVRSLPPDLHWYSLTAAIDDENWLASIPHRRRDPPVRPDERATVFRLGRSDETFPRVTVAHATSEGDIPPECRVVLSCDGDAIRIIQHPDPAHRVPVLPGFVSRVEAASWAGSLVDDPRARDAGEAGLPPRSAALAALLPSAATSDDNRRLDCQPMVGAAGPITIDLVADGPHSVVGGTTGSGKSELLVSWVLAMAAAHSPEHVSFLLVDFKGGSAFGPLETLPHTVGTITDLDEHEATRALASIRAELRLRERTIAEAGARSIEESTLPRLVIVVDEFAAMLAEFPDLHALFADIAARGRSLGVHLILCTQRPSGAVRDGVLANADLRISLRVNNRADSDAVVGVRDAAELDASARGRAIMRRSGGEPVLAQVALASAEDVASITARWVGVVAPRRPWRDRLPALVPVNDLTATGRGISLGLVDLPDEQRQLTWDWDPVSDGHLVVLGAPRTGKSTALAGLGATSVPSSPPLAWDMLEQRIASLDAGAVGPELLSIDDLDALVPRFSAEHRGVWLEWLGRLLREGPARGIHLAIAAQRLQGELHAIGALAPARVMLGHNSRQDWVIAGGDGADFLPATTPGAGRWRGHRVQVALFPKPTASDAPPHCVDIDPARALAVASTRAVATAERLRRAGWATISTEAATSATAPLPKGTAVVADPDDWQARWGLLGALRETCTVVLDACSLADVRLLTRSRQPPPPLPADPALAWQFRLDGSLARIRLPTGGEI